MTEIMALLAAPVAIAVLIVAACVIAGIGYAFYRGFIGRPL